MTYAELVKKVQKRAEYYGNKKVQQRQTEELLEAVRWAIFDALKSGEIVTLPGIGRLEVEVRAARHGTNPKTGQPITIPAHKVVRLRVARYLKETLNSKW